MRIMTISGGAKFDQFDGLTLYILFGIAAQFYNLFSDNNSQNHTDDTSILIRLTRIRCLAYAFNFSSRFFVLPS